MISKRDRAHIKPPSASAVGAVPVLSAVENCDAPAAAGTVVGRPPKLPETKAKGVTVTLWPHEYDSLERLLTRVNQGLPAAVSRSDLARLAFALLFRLDPLDIRQELAKSRS